ncbi:MAG: Phosphomannomutase [Candidatus Magasanikbacteria bacterium GW2011_GWA2_56_11]|uniref:Phosphomannomutase n=1 Tax=Candidatus Magasanikbacteria bacterium GW2011_GWA2_56_11 TaxID=1619044 RepID=A0A0G1YDL6_9BACT|nr:MAG: Phosphomannomutase [Candidatus Magasanikbacteria bacterium GW2011_GWA2_56_11]
MSFPTHIFKAYDIRGLADGEITEELAYRVGRSFVRLLRQRGVELSGRSLVVARDMRPTSRLLEAAVERGIADEGVDVAGIGLASTPLFNFACTLYPEHAGGIIVTASHNPAQYNGFKLTLDSGLPIGKDSGMEEIHDLAAADFPPPAGSLGRLTKKSVLADYEDMVFGLVGPGSIRPLKLVVDAGNGMAQTTLPKILERLPVTVNYLYLEPDGTFPNHEANPLKTETLADLQAAVKEHGADFGFALDGDADRIGLVDETGAVVDASYVAALIGLEVLRRHPGSVMLYDLRSSQIVREVWEAAGARPEMCRVGHAFIKRLLPEKKAVFASELSLHLYYSDCRNLECSDLSLLYVLQLLSRSGQPLSSLVRPLRKYFHSGEINFTAPDPAAVIRAVESAYRDSALEVSHLDGLWLKFDWGWLNLRPSNTEPVVRLNLEARTNEIMRAKIEEVSQVLFQYVR